MSCDIPALLIGTDFELKRARQQTGADRKRVVMQTAGEKSASNDHRAPLRKVLDGEKADIATGLEFVVPDAYSNTLRQGSHIGCGPGTIFHRSWLTRPGVRINTRSLHLDT